MPKVALVSAILPRLRAGIASLSLFSILLSGCTGASDGATLQVAPETDEAPKSPVRAEFDQNTGGIDGLVVSDSLEPLASAEVILEGTGLVATTDIAGAFAFDRLEPGSYRLLAQARGFELGILEVSVQAGKSVPAKILVAPIPSQQPYHQTFLKRGFWECIVNVVIGSPPCNLSDDPRRSYSFEIGPAWNSTLYELEWRHSNPGQATTPGASFSNLGKSQPGNKTLCFGEVFGKSAPLRYRFVPGHWMALNCNTVARNATQALPAGSFLHYGWAFPWGMLADETQSAYNLYAAGRSRGAGLSYNQPFNLYYTVFYNAPGPLQFSAMPDQ